MRALSFDTAARRQFDALPDKQFRQVISAVFALLEDPRPADSRHLSGSPYYRITVGEYRVVYDFTDEMVRVVAFGKRNDGELAAIAEREKRAVLDDLRQSREALRRKYGETPDSTPGIRAERDAL